MSDDFKVGDVAVKVSGLCKMIPKGTMCKVSATRWHAGSADIPPCQVLYFMGWEATQGRSGFVAYNFKKLPPAEPEFISLIRGLGVGKGVREYA